jgi:hypothetical protein
LLPELFVGAPKLPAATSLPHSSSPQTS